MKKCGKGFAIAAIVVAVIALYACEAPTSGNTGGNVAVTGVTVGPATASIAVAATQQLTATVAPTTATNQTVTWSTSASATATVSTSGLVTGVAAGTATITATTADGSFTGTCAVTVTGGGGGAFPTGTFDSGFTGAGCFYTLGATDLVGKVLSLAVQSDGKVLAGGWFNKFNGSAAPSFVRLNTDGTLDATFNPGGAGPNGMVNAIIVQPDSKILIGGSSSTYNGVSYWRFARLNADGSLDTTVPTTSIGSSIQGVLSMALQSDGKILLGTQDHGVMRLNSDGTPDSTFAATTADSYVLALAVQSDGKIVVGGKFGVFNGVTQGRITRLNANGTLDTTFNPSGVGLKTLYSGGSQVTAIKVLSDGKLLVTGDMLYYNAVSCSVYILRLNADGTRDTGFSNSGVTALAPNNPTMSINAMELQSDGKILIGGLFPGTYYSPARSRIARLNANGSLDTTFDPGTGCDYPGSSASVYAMVLYNGTLIAGGQFTNYNGNTKSGIVRIQ